MAKILLFGSYDIFAVPGEVAGWIAEYIRGGHSFIVGDNKGSDVAFHKLLSSLGAQEVTIYAMDSARNNVYDFPVKSYKTSFDVENKQVTIYTEDGSTEPFYIDDVEKEQDIVHNRQWYGFRDKQMIMDCDVAIGLWNGDSKAALHMIQLLNIYNKPVYTFTIG